MNNNSCYAWWSYFVSTGNKRFKSTKEMKRTPIERQTMSRMQTRGPVDIVAGIHDKSDDVGYFNLMFNTIKLIYED